MYNKLDIQNKILKVVVGVLVLVNAFIYAHLASAITSYPPGSLLQPSDVTSSHIRNDTIVDVDISTSAAISATKISPRGTTGTVLITDGTNIATSTAIKIATSTGDFYVLGGRLHASSTGFNGVDYTWPTADGSNGQLLGTNGSGTLSFSSPGTPYLSYAHTAGTSTPIVTPMWIATSTGTSATVGSTATTNAGQYFGRCGANPVYQAQTFEIPANVSIASTTISLSIIGSPTDSAVIELLSGSTGTGAVAVIASTTIAYTALTASETSYGLTFFGEYRTTYATTTFMRLGRTGSCDSTNHYFVGNNSTNPYAGGTGWWNDGTTWTQVAGSDLKATLGHTALIAGRSYPLDDWDTIKNLYYVGIATAASVAGTSLTTAPGGIVQNLTGLSPGTNYYTCKLNTGLCTTISTVGKIGQAISTTELRVNPMFNL